MDVKKHEAVLVVTDEHTVGFARPLFSYAKKVAAESLIIEMKSRKINGEEPPAAVAEAMKKADVVLILTTKSITHTEARKNASKTGARVASMGGVTKAMLKRAIDVNYKKMDILNKKLAALFTKANMVHLKTSKGTDLTFSIKARKGTADSGIFNNKGKSGNLPAGEMYIAPVEGTAEGVYVVDESMAGIGKLSSPLKIIVKKGFAVKFEGKSAAKLRNLIKDLGKPSKNIAELGIGTNPKAVITGKTLEDEKKIGTCHVAIGDNTSFGGKVKAKSHLDGVIRNPTIYLDTKKIMQNGKLLV